MRLGHAVGQPAVHAITLHRSKGLQFPYVYIPSIQPGIFPSKSAFFIIEQLEEERRLLYVGMTRAQKQLFLSRHKSDQPESWAGFLQEIYPEHSFSTAPKELHYGEFSDV